MNFPPMLWPRISLLFDEGRGLGEAERAAWLQALTAREPECEPYVRSMLDASAAPARHGDDPLATGLDAMRASALASALHGANLSAGAMLGPYRLVEPLGEGGMASVWLAEQTAGVLRRVALKVPHAGLEEGEAAARRFTQERDFLAALEHPHIARLYDAGISEQGQPYLAMELISGVPITAYCENHRLTIAQRLALFDQVLAAVGHAHARLVIHRDLKAGNILVTPDGQVKLLDFGIARLLDDGAAGGAGAGAESRVFTPDAASPEQLAGQRLTVASDVYSLGVVLYDMLCGQRPYRLNHAEPDLAAQLLAVHITPPSECSIDAASAAARASTPNRLRRALSGELDAIVLKALQADAGLRYASVDAMARDLQRHLTQRPVEALPATPGYRASRYLARNRWAVLSAGAVTLALCAGLVLALWQASVADAQARRAREVQAFMKQIFRGSEPEQAQGRDIGARELLQRGGARLETDLKDQPEVLAEMQSEIGDILLALGANAEGKPYLERALATFERLGQGESDAGVQARLNLADLLINEAQWEPARALAQRSVDLALPKRGPPRAWALRARAQLALIDAATGHAKEAAALLETALAEHLRGGRPLDKDSVDAYGDLGHAYMQQERYDKAKEAFAQSASGAASLKGVKVTTAAVMRLQLNWARFFLNETEAVANDMPSLVAAMDSHLGPRSGHTLNARSLWAQALVALGRHDQGIQVQTENVAHAEARQSVDGDALAYQRGVLAILLRAAGRYAEGLSAAERSLAFVDGKFKQPNWRAEYVRLSLGDLQRGNGQAEAGLRSLELAASRARTLPRHDRSVRFAAILQSLALAQQHAGQQAEALRNIAQAQAIFQANDRPGDLKALRNAVLQSWLVALSQPHDAAVSPGFEQAASAYAARQPAGRASHAELDLMRADLHQAAGRVAQARELRGTASAAWRASMGREWQPPLVMLH